jgi:hypothetical protein
MSANKAPEIHKYIMEKSNGTIKSVYEYIQSAPRYKFSIIKSVDWFVLKKPQFKLAGEEIPKIYPLKFKLINPYNTTLINKK